MGAGTRCLGIRAVICPCFVDSSWLIEELRLPFELKKRQLFSQLVYAMGTSFDFGRGVSLVRSEGMRRCRVVQ